jgi:transposase
MAPGIGLGLRGCWRVDRPKVAAIALANKIARMTWAMMARRERYREPIALAA